MSAGKPIPESENALVLRTDFSNAEAWESVRAAIRKPAVFRANVQFVSDPEYDGMTLEQLLPLIRDGSNHTFIFLVDRTTLTHPEQPILVVDLDNEPGRSFRVVPSELWGIENNLSIANMDFEEFADAAEDDGVFRGFPH